MDEAQHPLHAALPVPFFDWLPDDMLEVIIEFSCEGVPDFLKVGRIDRRFLECSRKPWVQERLKIDPETAFAGVIFEEAITRNQQGHGR